MFYLDITLSYYQIYMYSSCKGMYGPIHACLGLAADLLAKGHVHTSVVIWEEVTCTFHVYVTFC